MNAQLIAKTDGAQTFAAGIVAVNRAQERGYTFVNA